MNKNMKFSAIAALLLSAGLLSAPAAIAASAYASLGPITVTVVPLETGATLTWVGEEFNSGYASAISTDPDASDSSSHYNSDRDSFFSILASVPSANAFASSTPSLSGLTLFSSADALQTTTLQSTSSSGSANDRLGFTTSGVVAIYITADYSIFADSGDGLSYAYAYDTLSLNFSSKGSDHISNFASTFSLDRVLSSGGFYYNDGIVSDSGVLSTGIVTSGHGSGYIDRQVSAGAYQYAFSVPEPETYAMLLAGLGLLGFMARRRKESTV